MTPSEARGPLVPGHHWVSPVNYEPSVQDTYDFAQPLTVYDSTVRKLFYTTGSALSVGGALRISEALESIGVKEVRLNVDWQGNEEPWALEFAAVRAILARRFAFHTTVWCGALMPTPIKEVVTKETVIETLQNAGMETLQVAVAYFEGLPERQRQSERLAEVLTYARSRGLKYSMTMGDFGRWPFDYVVQIANEAIGLGAIEIDLSDAAGSLSPEAMKVIVRRFREQMVRPVPVIVHVHDDFGLASASALAAATAGAHPDVSVNGVSYRTGFAVFEEVALALETLYGVKTGLRLEMLQSLSDTVERESGISNYVLKPITGRHAYLRDRPQWVLPYLRKGPDAFPPPASCVAPAAVGGHMSAAWGTQVSEAVLEAKLEQMKLPTDKRLVRSIREQIEQRVERITAYPRWLTEAEVEDICRSIAASVPTAAATS